MNTAVKLWNPNFIKYIIAFEFSEMGSAMLSFAIPLYILMATNNPALLGTVLSLNLIPFVFFTSLGGVLADRVDKRKFIVLTNLLIAFVIGLYVLLTCNMGELAISIVLLFLMSVLQALQASSFETVLYSIIPMDDLMKAGSVTHVMMIGSGLIVPVLTGFLLRQWGLESIVLISFSLFLLSALTNFLMKVKVEKQPVSDRGALKTIFEDLKSGLRFFQKENPTLRKATLGLFLYAIVINPALNMVPTIFIINQLGRTETDLGLAQGLISLGGVLGVLFLGKLGEKANETKLLPLLTLMAILSIATTILFFFTSGTSAFLILIGGTFSINTIVSIYSMIYFTYLGQNTPEDIVGKVMAFSVVVMVLGGAASQFITGRIFGLLGENLVLGALMLPMIVLALIPFTIQRKNKLAKQPEVIK